MGKIQCVRCGNVRYTDQPSPEKDEIGAAICWNCREVTICRVYAKEEKMMCEFCENMKPLIGDDQDGACIENGNILVSYGECTDFAKGRINYCPMCGRKLTEDHDAEEV